MALGFRLGVGCIGQDSGSTAGRYEQSQDNATHLCCVVFAKWNAELQKGREKPEWQVFVGLRQEP